MNEDTLHLLSECAAGTDMAIRSLEERICHIDQRNHADIRAVQI